MPLNNQVVKLTDDDREELLSHTPYILPDNPSNKGFSASQIKRKLYEGFIYLFNLVKDFSEQTGDTVDAILAEVVTKSGEEVITGQKTFKDKVIINAQGSGNNGELDLYYAYIVTNSKDYFAKAGATSATASVYKLPYSADSATYTIATTDMIEEIWAEEATHHHLKTDSEGYVYEELPEEDSADTSGNRIMNHADGIAITDEVKQLKEAIAALLGVKSNEYLTIEKILDGHITTGHATESNRTHMDMDGDHIDVSNYAKTVTLSYDSTNGKVTAKLFNQAGVEISSNTVDLPAELVFTNQYYDSTNKKLVFVPASGGSNIEISLSDLVDTYTAGTDSDGICNVTINDHTIKVSVADGSISMAKLSSTLQSTWNGWVSAEADRVLAENGRVAAEAQRVLNENARLARPYLDIEDGYLTINYGTGHSITID